MPPATAKPARKPKPPAAPPPVGPDLRAALAALTRDLAPHLAGVLKATDAFDVTRQSGSLSDHDRRLAAEMIKAVRDAWSVLSWWSEEAARTGKEPTK